MIASQHFSAAVVIGGMEGIFEEVDIFKRLHPRAQILPLATTAPQLLLFMSRATMTQNSLRT